MRNCGMLSNSAVLPVIKFMSKMTAGLVNVA